MSRTDHWKLGLFVLLGTAIGIVALVWLGANLLRRSVTHATTYFDESVQGLDVGSPVKFRGVTLGTVASITVATDKRHVEVHMDIFRDELQRLGLNVTAPLSPDVRVQLAAAGITGVKFLQVDFFDPSRYPPPTLPFEPDENYVPSVPSTLKNIEDVATEFLVKLPQYGDKLEKLVDEGRAALFSLKRVATMVEDPDGSVQQLIRRVDHAVQGVETAVASAEVGKTTGSLRDAAQDVKIAANRLGGLGDGVDATLVSLREALEQVRALASTLEENPTVLLRGRRPDAVPAVGVHK